jgi:outer membrane protein W
MKHLIACSIVIAFAVPGSAQRRVDLFVDAEGVHRSGRTVFEPNVVQYEPRFDNGGGIGGGLNLFLSDRVSIEVKVAALKSRLHIRRTGSDFVTVGDLGFAQIDPITALLQWHMLERASLRPYVGIGAGHVILRNIEKRSGGVSGARFKDPTGLVVDGGLEISLSRRWSVLGDARYTPIETHSRVTFLGTGSSAQIDVKPLVVSTGIAFRF